MTPDAGKANGFGTTGAAPPPRTYPAGAPPAPNNREKPYGSGHTEPPGWVAAGCEPRRIPPGVPSAAVPFIVGAVPPDGGAKNDDPNNPAVLPDVPAVIIAGVGVDVPKRPVVPA